jgi:hypothetical protein
MKRLHLALTKEDGKLHEAVNSKIIFNKILNEDTFASNDLLAVAEEIKRKGRFRNVSVENKNGENYILLLRTGESIKIFKKDDCFRLVHYTYMDMSETYTSSLDIDELILEIRRLYSFGYH